MRAIIAGREEIININIVSQYYEFLTGFFHLVDNIRKGAYVLGSGQLVNSGAEDITDEDNPNNPYWVQVKRMKEEADMEIARDREIRERIRLEKQQKEMARQKEIRKSMEKKVKRITKRKPKIKPKRVIPQERLKLLELKKLARKRIEKDKLKKTRQKKSKSAKGKKR